MVEPGLALSLFRELRCERVSMRKRLISYHDCSMRGLQLISKTHSPLGHAPPLLGGRTWKFLRTRRNRGAPPSSSSSFGWSTESDVPAPPEEEDAKGPTRARLRMRKNTLRDYWE